MDLSPKKSLKLIHYCLYLPPPRHKDLYLHQDYYWPPHSTLICFQLSRQSSLKILISLVISLPCSKAFNHFLVSDQNFIMIYKASYRFSPSLFLLTLCSCHTAISSWERPSLCLPEEIVHDPLWMKCSAVATTLILWQHNCNSPSRS